MLRLKQQLKLTAVVVTHDLDLMYKVADRVVFLYRRQGDLLRQGERTGEVATIRTFGSSWRWTRYCDKASAIHGRCYGLSLESGLAGRPGRCPHEG